MIVFDDGPQIVLLREGGHAPHVQYTLAHLGHRTVGGHVLEVDERNALAQPVQQRKRVMTGVGGPVDIQFNFDEPGIGDGQEMIEQGLACHAGKFKVVVMITKFDARVTAALPDSVEPRPQRPDAIQGAPFLSKPG